tara:strand:+ start:56 stop:490 length:435 start_codon:yes stop_codon:yes gene_type:complete
MLNNISKGKLVERKCANLYAEEGYEVYECIFFTGIADFVVYSKETKEFQLIDAKTPHETGGTQRTKEQIEHNVQIVVYDPKENTKRDVRHNYLGRGIKSMKPVIAEGVYYESQCAAARHYGCTKTTIKRRVLNPNRKWVEWKYA